MGSNVGNTRGGNAGRAALIASIPAPGAKTDNALPAPGPNPETVTPDTGAAATTTETAAPTGQVYPNLVGLSPTSDIREGYLAAYGKGAPPRSQFLDPADAKLAQNIFQRPVSANDLAALVGAPNGSQVAITRSTLGAGERIQIDVGHPLMGEHTYEVYRNQNNQLEMHTDLFMNNPNAPRGFGTAIFAQQLQQARRLGVGKLSLLAAGYNGNSVYNGYYTWARFGYQTPFQLDEREAMPAHLRSSSMNDLMQKPGGAAWWRENGHSFSGFFNTDPQSVSSRIFSYYMQEHGLTAKG